MRKFSLFLVVLTLGLFGCTDKSQEAYDSAINDGVTASEKGEYAKAEAFFEMALKEKEEDKQATAYLSQAKEIQEMTQAISDGELEDGLSAAEKIEKEETKLEPVQEEAKELRKQLETAKDTLEELTQQYEEAEKLVKASDYETANKLLTQIKQPETNEAFYIEIMAKITQLTESTSKKLEEQAAEKEKKLAEEKKKAEEQQQKEKEAEQAKQAAEAEAASVSIVPAQYIGYWGETGASASLFQLTGTHYIDSSNGKSYEISNVGQSGGVLTLSWDIEEFEQRNGAGSAGPGPQPFMFYINSDGTLGSMSGKSTLSKM